MIARKLGVLVCVCMLLSLSVAWGANTLDVTSLTVAPNQTDVVIPIRLQNDVPIRGMDLPFVIRTVSGGAYITAAKMEYGDRLTTYLTDIRFLNHYNHGITDTAACKRFTMLQPKSPGGFFGNPDYNGTDKQTVTGVPYGIMFATHRLLAPDMPAGADVTGSCLLTVDIGALDGVFEIDSVCIDPFIHIGFNTVDNQRIVPAIAKGVITVGFGNNPPVAVDDEKGARAGVTLYVVGAGVLTNDSDPDGDPLTVVLDTDVSHGVLELHSDGTLFYTPENGYDGIDQFTYYANDGQANSASPATVTLHVIGGGPAAAGDYDEDGQLTAIDLGKQIDALFSNGPDPIDGGCRDWPRGDIDCDGFTTSIDLAKMIDYLFVGGAAPCNPCEF